MKIIYILVAVSILHSCDEETISIKENDYPSKVECEKDAETFKAEHHGEYIKVSCDAVAVKP